MATADTYDYDSDTEMHDAAKDLAPSPLVVGDSHSTDTESSTMEEEESSDDDDDSRSSNNDINVDMFDCDLGLDDASPVEVDRSQLDVNRGRFEQYLSEVASILDALPCASNQSQPLDASTWTNGLNSKLFESIQSTRYPAFPRCNRDLYTCNDAPHPVPLPRHIDLPAINDKQTFAQLTLSRKCLTRQKKSDCATWQLRSMGMQMACHHSDVYRTYVLGSNGYINKSMDISVWHHAIKGYRLVSFSGQDDGETWSLYASTVLGFGSGDRREIQRSSTGGLILLASHRHNSMEQLERLVDLALTKTEPDSTGKLRTTRLAAITKSTHISAVENVILGAIYTVALHFWLLCRQRFMERFDGSRPDLPESIFIFNPNLDLAPTECAKRTQESAEAANIPHVAPMELENGTAIVGLAKRLPMWAFCVKCLEHHSIVSLISKLPGCGSVSIGTFIRRHIYSNRTKALLSRGFTFHQAQPILDFVNSRYVEFSSVASTSHLAVTYTLKQHPSASKNDVCVAHVTAHGANSDLGDHVPTFASHAFMSALVPIFSFTPEDSDINFSLEQDERELRWTLDRVGRDCGAEREGRLSSATPLSRRQKALFASTALPPNGRTPVPLTVNATHLSPELQGSLIQHRTSVTFQVFCMMQLLPFTTPTNAKMFDAIIKCIFGIFPDTLRMAYVITDEHFYKGWKAPASYTYRELPSSYKATMAMMPRSYDTRLSHTASRYACFVNKSPEPGGPSTIYRYVHEFQSPNLLSSFRMNIGDQHILAVSRSTWLWLLYEARIRVDPSTTQCQFTDMQTQMQAQSTPGTRKSRYLSLASLDAWQQYQSGSIGDLDFYPLWILVSYYVTTELELISLFVFMCHRVGLCQPLGLLAAKDRDHIPDWTRELLERLKASAKDLFHRSVRHAFSSPCVRPMQLPQSVHTRWDGIRYTPPDATAATYALISNGGPQAVRASERPLFTQNQIHVWSFDTTDSSKTCHQIETGIFQTVNVICAREVSQGKELVVPIDTKFDVSRGSCMNELFDRSATFRKIVLSVVGQTEWHSGSRISVSRSQLVALMVLWFNAEILELLTHLKDFQLPVSLVDGVDSHWSKHVMREDIIDELEMYHSEMDRQVKELGTKAESITRQLNSDAILSPTTLREWAARQRSYFAAVDAWIVSQRRDDPKAMAVHSLYARICNVLAEATGPNTIPSGRPQVTAGSTAVATSSSPVPPPSSSISQSSQIESSGETSLRVQELISSIQLELHAHHQQQPQAIYMTPARLTSLSYRLAIATGSSDPNRIQTMLRAIIEKLYTRDSVFATVLERSHRSTIEEIRRMCAPPSRSRVQPPTPTAIVHRGTATAINPTGPIGVNASAARFGGIAIVS